MTMFNNDQHDNDEEWLNKSKEKPDINKLDIGGLGKFSWDGLVQGVHNKHGCYGHWYTGLEVFLLEVESHLTEIFIAFISDKYEITWAMAMIQIEGKYVERICQDTINGIQKWSIEISIRGQVWIFTNS